MDTSAKALSPPFFKKVLKQSNDNIRKYHYFDLLYKIEKNVFSILGEDLDQAAETSLSSRKSRLNSKDHLRGNEEL